MDSQGQEKATEMPSEREKRIVGAFLDGYNDRFQSTFNISEWPEETERAKHSRTPREAIEALAVDSAGKTLAIEHTRIEAFDEAGRIDAEFRPISAAFKDPSQCIPGYHVMVSMRLDSVAGLSAFERRKLGQEFTKWFRAIRLNLPDGKSSRRPWLCGRPRALTVYKRRHEGFGGAVSFHRYPKPPFLPRLRRALRDKVPKLLQIEADKRILLLERRDYDTPHSWAVAKALKRLRSSYDLSQVIEIWLVDTSYILFGDGRNVWFSPVCPEGISDFSFFREDITDLH